jgi:hypothetical protein
MAKILKALLLTWILAGTALMAAGKVKAPVEGSQNDQELMKLIKTAMSSRMLIQTVVKDYLYAGNDVATTRAKGEMKKALKLFEERQKKLEEAFTDPKIKNLMTFIRMNLEEMKETLKEPYSRDNAEVLIDLGEAISEGEQKIASQLRKKLSKQYPAAKGQRYYIAQIAKYYMAYESGIKDENTVRQMEKTVKTIDSLIREMKAYQGNTVKMNQTLNQIEKLWKVVKQFYLDIEEGGLPIIVFQTTDKLDKKFREYAQLMIASISKK